MGIVAVEICALKVQKQLVTTVCIGFCSLSPRCSATFGSGYILTRKFAGRNN
jgi:hypothetical protein